MLVDFLNQEFERRRKQNPRYSIRAFAKKISLDDSTLSKILKRSRALTVPTAKKILDALGVEESLKASLLLSLHEKQIDSFPKDSDFVVPSVETLEWMSKWEFYAVLSLLELPKIKHDAETFARRLNSKPEIIKEIFSCLLKHGIMEEVSGRYKLSGLQLTFPPSLGNSALQNVHAEYIEKAKQSLKTQDSTVRNVTGFTFTMASNKLPEASRRIRDFARVLGKYLESENVDSVYRLNVQLFPLTTTKTLSPK